MKIDHAIDLYTEHLETDPLALLPDDLKMIITEFWQSLSITDQRAGCPICDDDDLEVRQTTVTRRIWLYVLHCGGCWLIGYPSDEVQ